MNITEILKALPDDQRVVVEEAISKKSGIDIEAIQKSIEEKFSSEIKKLKEDSEAEIKKQKEDNDKLSKALEAEQDIRITKEFVAKADQYKDLGINAVEFGKVLKGISNKAPDEYAEVIKTLDAAEEKLSKNNILLKEIGNDSAPVSDVEDQINKIAAEYRKVDPSLTSAKAIAKAWKENPQYYSDYENEKHGK